MKKFAVIGNPIKQSKSPEIHLQFAEQFGHAIEYTKLLASAESFEAEVQKFIADGATGMNVTAPFKLNAAHLADSLSERAKSAHAVNTLLFKNNKIYGDNTDGLGLVRDIQTNLGHPIKGKKILIIGAGGAARGILLPILDNAPESLTIINRTAQKAKDLADTIKSEAQINTGGFSDVAGQYFDIVINATSAGLDKAALPTQEYKFAKNSLAYDLVYDKKPTLFMQQSAANKAARTSDGLGMLVEQAAYSYKLWLGAMPDTKPVLRALRQSI